MRHLKRKRNLGISPSHRSSLLSNLAVSILDKERIVTTVAKAKEVRGLVERLITFGKKGDIHSMRIAAKVIENKTLLKKLFSEIAPSFKDREGGYTRIIKLDYRKGDNAPTAIIELTGRDGQEIANRRKKKSKQADAVSSSAKTPASSKKSEKAETSKTPKAPKVPKKAETTDAAVEANVEKAKTEEKPVKAEKKAAKVEKEPEQKTEVAPKKKKVPKEKE
jgi:large subunit ribosomal protein L17